MKSTTLKLPAEKAREYGHRLAYQIAREHLAGIDDLSQQCLKSDAQYVDSHKIIIHYLNELYQITLPDADVTPLSGGEAVPVREKLLMLHYFAAAKGTPPSGMMITFKELPEGVSYFPTFLKRTIEPMVGYFGRQPGRLVDIAEGMGGRKTEYGDAAITINAFSRVPVTLVLWHGDEEFPAQGSILFDSTVTDYLPTEDIIVLCETIIWRLVRLLKAGGDNPGRR